MNTWILDIRFALRSLTKNLGFTLAAVLSLAIGIGANTSIFSVANALLFRPLPYDSPDRLVILWNRSPGLNITQDWFSTAQYFDIKTGHHGFEQLAIAIGGNYNLTGQGDPERVGVVRVSSNLLQMFGVCPALGRLLTPDEDSPGRPSTAVLTDGMWARRFGRDPQRSVNPSSSMDNLMKSSASFPKALLCRRKFCPCSTERTKPKFFCPYRSRPPLLRKCETTKTTTSSES